MLVQDVGPEDLAHLLKLERWGRICTGLGYATAWIAPNPISAFLRVTLPLSIPGILAGSVLAFGINVESFVVPILLGGGKVRFMSVAAYEMATSSNNLPFAATIGVILLVVTMLMLGLYQWAVRSVGRSATGITG